MPTSLANLRAAIRRIEGRDRRGAPVLPFRLEAIDAHLPEGGLARGALHEVAGGEGAATLFAAGIAARAGGQVLWCLARPDIFAPALAQAGLAADRVIYAEGGDERTVLACFEEGLRHGGLGAVVAELARLPMAASRRLQLAAESSGTLGLALRRWSVAGESNAATTRWRVASRPSAPLPVPGVGRARWRVELVRCRGGEPAAFEVEGCDAAGRLAVPAELRDRPGQAGAGRTAA